MVDRLLEWILYKRRGRYSDGDAKDCVVNTEQGANLVVAGKVLTS